MAGPSSKARSGSNRSLQHAVAESETSDFQLSYVLLCTRAIHTNWMCRVLRRLYNLAIDHKSPDNLQYHLHISPR